MVAPTSQELLGGVTNDNASSFPIPVSTPAESLARDSFTQLMWALSYPGRVYTLPTPADKSPSSFASCAAIGHTLLDLETSFFTTNNRLLPLLAQNGARAVEPENAAYHFYLPEDSTQPTHEYIQSVLACVADAAVGTLLYPDQAATLVVACTLGDGEGYGASDGLTLRLKGPGILGEATIVVGGLPLAFWQLRADRVSYPLGWDLFLVDGNRVVGLPRTTAIEIVEHIANSITEGEA